GSASVAVSGGTSAYTYSWSPSGGTAATATGLTAGTYTVTVTDANSCQITQSFTITEPAALTASPVAQTNIACFGGNTGSATISATGGTGGYTYSWSPSGGTAATATGLTAGTYTVTVTDSNLC
ncbi:SprB repeat-containing protein, partial [Flavobacterium panici]|uniref:SprB repeat-containing protein n=2 Tax=Flavobacterium TaxID=237 RepID=UPI0015DEFAC6